MKKISIGKDINTCGNGKKCFKKAWEEAVPSQSVYLSKRHCPATKLIDSNSKNCVLRGKVCVRYLLICCKLTLASGFADLNRDT